MLLFNILAMLNDFACDKVSTGIGVTIAFLLQLCSISNAKAGIMRILAVVKISVLAIGVFKIN